MKEFLVGAIGMVGAAIWYVLSIILATLPLYVGLSFWHWALN